MHICISKLTITGSDNGLSPSRHQAIIWTNAGILLIGHLRINFSGILIEIYTVSFKKMHLKMSSGKWRPYSLGLNVLKHRVYWNMWVTCETWRHLAPPEPVTALPGLSGTRKNVLLYQMFPSLCTPYGPYKICHLHVLTAYRGKGLNIENADLISMTRLWACTMYQFEVLVYSQWKPIVVIMPFPIMPMTQGTLTWETTTFPIGWVHTQNNTWLSLSLLSQIK